MSCACPYVSGGVEAGAEGVEERVELNGAEGMSRMRPYMSSGVEAGDDGIEGCARVRM
jgi:hypothetical protein